MISLTTVLLLLMALGAVWALIDLFFGGRGLTKELRRWLRSKHGDYVEIDLSSDLATAVANGLIGVGSEVVAGYESEWDGVRVARFAISPEILRKPIGTHLKVIRLDPQTLQLLPVNDPLLEQENKANKSCEATGDNVSS